MLTQHFCFIIGAQKCGTSTLFALLSQHPEITNCSEKEPGFFSLPWCFAKGLGWYLSLWNGNQVEKDYTKQSDTILLEASTHYTKSPIFPSGAYKIKKFVKRPKFIYIVRDPIERIESHINWDMMRGRYISKPNLIQTNNLQDLHKNIIYNTKYMEQTKPYLDLFGLDKCLIINFHNLVKKPKSILFEICNFLKIDTKFVFKIIHRNSTPQRISKHRQLCNYANFNNKKMLTQFIPYQLKHINIKKTKLTEAEIQSILHSLSKDIKHFYDTFGWYPMGKFSNRIIQCL